MNLCFLSMTCPVFGQSANHLPQQIPSASQGQMPSGPVTSGDHENPIEAQAARQRLKLMDEQRQKQLIEDTNKLVSLANELKEEVDKSTKDTLSLSVIRKAEQIEKLAKSVKEKMKADRVQ